MILSKESNFYRTTQHHVGDTSRARLSGFRTLSRTLAEPWAFGSVGWQESCLGECSRRDRPGYRSWKAENWGGANRKPLRWYRWAGEPELDGAGTPWSASTQWSQGQVSQSIWCKPALGSLLGWSSWVSQDSAVSEPGRPHGSQGRPDHWPTTNFAL